MQIAQRAGGVEAAEGADNPPRAAGTVQVLHVINGEHYAGAERVQDLLALHLGQWGFEVGFACVKPDRFARLREARKAPLYELRMRSRLDVTCVRKLARLIRKQGYGLVHTHTPRAAMVGGLAAALAGVRVVHHLHSPTVCDSTRRLRNWVNAAAERASVARSDAVIAVSQAMAAYARRLAIAPSRITIVPNGVATRGPLAQRMRPSSQWTLGVVGLFRPRKGLDVLVRALAELKEQGRPIRLRAVGTFETAGYEKEVRSLAERLGVADAIDWQGFVADVHRELDRIDLLVLPSLFGEGLPMVVLEAMAAGVPMVATRVEGVTEALRDGIDGLTVPPGDPPAIAQAVRLVMEGQVDWQAMRSNAHRRQAEFFSAARMAGGVAEVYRQVLNPPQPSNEPQGG